MSGIISVILCGGEGRRLAPFSTPDFPKQFMHIGNPKGTLFQQAVGRGSGISGGNVIISTNVRYQDIINPQLDGYDTSRFSYIYEPASLNTAISVAMAAIYSMQYGDPVLCILPSDHIILKEDELREKIISETPKAKAGKIVLFGITPDDNSRSYGYICAEGEDECRRVKIFTEKPDPKKAKEMMKEGNCFWNSGIFLFKCSTIIKEISKCLPDTFLSVKRSLENRMASGGSIYPDEASLKNLFPVQLDKEVIQKSSNLVVRPVEVGWQDVGNVESVHLYAFKKARTAAVN